MALGCREEQVRGNFPFASKPLCLHLGSSSQQCQLLLSVTISPEILLGSGPWGNPPLSKLIFKVPPQPSRLIK